MCYHLRTIGHGAGKKWVINAHRAPLSDPLASRRPSHASLVYPWETLGEPLVPLIKAPPPGCPAPPSICPPFRGLFRGFSLFLKKKKLIERERRERGLRARTQGVTSGRTWAVAKMRRMKGLVGVG